MAFVFLLEEERLKKPAKFKYPFLLKLRLSGSTHSSILSHLYTVAQDVSERIFWSNTLD